jgi:cyanophycin synthetase
VGLRLAGVDLVAPDLTRPLAPGFGAIVEVNGTPGLHYHYHVADTERASRVALPVLEKLLSEGGAKPHADVRL